MEWDTCCNNAWDIARTISIFAKERFRYIGRAKWEEQIDGEWKLDKHNYGIKAYIQNEVYSMIMQRSMHWQQEDIDLLSKDRITTNLLGIIRMIFTETHFREILKNLREFLEN